jgi:glycosyltransferase involved in cell wall biosynthesis
MEPNITIVLPTLNEEGNVGKVILSIFDLFKNEDFRVIIVDDNSVDKTREIVEEFTKNDARIQCIWRNPSDGLAGAIRDGVMLSKSSHVAWLDCDGSMPISDLYRMWTLSKKKPGYAVIGSRFVSGGMVKGQFTKNTGIIGIYRNLKISEDSFVAVVLSRIMNRMLRIILPTSVLDMTSGFIIIERKLLNYNDFRGFYGEYFPILVKILSERNVLFYEQAYINLPRVNGQSKTGSTLSALLRRGLPYLTISLKYRIMKD